MNATPAALVAACLVAASLLPACSRPAPPPPPPSPDVRAVTGALLEDFGLIGTTERPLFVTYADAIAWLREDSDGWQTQASLRPGVVSSFLAANSPGPAAYDQAWLGELGVGAVDGKSFAQHFIDRTLTEGWEHALAGPPTCTVVVSVSAPGFSDDGGQALLSIGASRGSLHGNGGLYLLEEVDGRWTVVRGLQFWDA